jgi:hypothetical protein
MNDEERLRQVEDAFHQMDRLIDAIPEHPEDRERIAKQVAAWQQRIRELELRRP